MVEFDIKDNILRKYKGGGIDVVVPDGVERISKNAFSGLAVRSVVLPDSVTHIRPRAFAGCSELKYIRLSEQLSEIANEAFYGCSNLEEIMIPNNVKVIDKKAFYACSSLKSIRLPEGLVCINGAAFMDCSALEEIDIPEGVRLVPENAFWGCKSLRRVGLPRSLELILSSAFNACSEISEVVLRSEKLIHISATCGLEETRWFKESPDEFVMISDRQLFKYRGRAQVLTIPSYIEYISRQAFGGNDTIEELTVPVTVKFVESDAFYSCTKLKKVWYAAAESDISVFDGCSALEEIRFEDNVSGVGPYCLYSCFSIRYIRIPKSMTDMEISVLPRSGSFDLELCHTSDAPPRFTMFNYGALHRVYAPYLTPDDMEPLGEAIKERAAMGYIDMCIQGRELSEEIRDAWERYIAPRCAAILQQVEQLEATVDYMCRNSLLTAEQADRCIELARGNVTATARLLDYKHALDGSSDYRLD